MRRSRKEFQHLEQQIEPGFLDATWKQFLDGLFHGILPTRSFQDQFELMARVIRGHARRDRQNNKLRRRRLEAFAANMCPEYLLFLNSGLVKLYDPNTGEARFDLMKALGDQRLARKLLFEMDIMREELNPDPVLIQPRKMGAVEFVPPAIVKRRAAFAELLMPTPIPEGTPSIVSFDPSLVKKTGTDNAPQPDIAPAAQRAS